MNDLDAANFLDRLRAECEIRNVLLNYFRGVDRKDFDLMASAYHSDAYDDHGTYKGMIEGLIAWVKERHKTIDQSMHFAGNSLIELAGSIAFVETYCITFQHIRTLGVQFSTGQAIHRYLNIGLRYVDRFELRDGAWKIAHRVVVYEWVREELGDLQMNPAWTISKRSTEDMLYLSKRMGDRTIS